MELANLGVIHGLVSYHSCLVFEYLVVLNRACLSKSLFRYDFEKMDNSIICIRSKVKTIQISFNKVILKLEFVKKDL